MVLAAAAGSHVDGRLSYLRFASAKRISRSHGTNAVCTVHVDAARKAGLANSLDLDRDATRIPTGPETWSIEILQAQTESHTVPSDTFSCRINIVPKHNEASSDFQADPRHFYGNLSAATHDR